MPVKDLYYFKYLKYKTKYVDLKSQLGGELKWKSKDEINFITTITITPDGNKILTFDKGTSSTTTILEDILKQTDINTIKLTNFIDYHRILRAKLKTISPDLGQYITTLIFDENTRLFTDLNAILSMFEMISRFSSLAHLSLKNCGITDTGIISLDKDTSKLVPSRLLKLNLENNVIGFSGANFLSNYLKKEELQVYLPSQKNKDIDITNKIHNMRNRFHPTQIYYEPFYDISEL